MTIQIPFNYIPASFRVPGTYVEVNNSQANTSQQTLVALLIGQVTSAGSLGPTTVATSALSSSSATLHFTSVPANIVPGMNVVDLTTSIAAVTVVSTTATTVVVSAPVSVADGDSIQFSPPSVPVLISSLPQAQGLFGPGSQLFNMVASYRANDTLGTLYALPLIDSPAGVAATCTINITGTITAANAVLSLYVCGASVPVLITSSMTNAQIAAAITAAINAAPNLPLTASGSTFPVTLTANNAGLAGNDLDCRINYYGSSNNEATPAGLVVNISGFANGATNPTLTAGLASLGSNAYDLICAPYTDTTSLNAIETFLDDETGRWSYLQQGLYGHYFAVNNNTLGNLTTFGDARNDQHATVLGIYTSPTPSFVIAAALTAQAAVSFRANPALPLQTLPLVGVLPPVQTNQWTISERETLLFNGISTYRVAADGQVLIDRVITTYQENGQGQPDDSYLDVCRMFLIIYASRYTVSQLSSMFPRCALADDGVRIPTGSNIVTPNTVLGALIGIYGELVTLGICQDFTTFSQDAVVQRTPLNPDSLDILMPCDFVNQLITTRISLQFTP